MRISSRLASTMAIFPEAGELTMAEGTADLTTGGNPMPNLRMAKRLESIAKHGTRASK